MASSGNVFTETDPLLPARLRDQDEEIQRRASVTGEAFAEVKHDIEWKSETKLLLSYSIPLIGTYLLQYFFQFVIVFVVAKIGTEELAAASLGITTMNITGYAVFEGLATALDTLCAQAAGSGNTKLIGLHMQRMVLFLMLLSIPIGALWLTSPLWLVQIVPQKTLALKAGAFLRVSLIGIPGYAMFEAGKRFAQAQGNFTASLVVLVVCAPIYLCLNWLFVFHLKLGLAGAALAAALTNNLRPLLLYLQLRTNARHTFAAWPPLSRAVFRNWSPMIWLSLPGTMMNLCEWFVFEILTFSTSYIGTPSLAAQTLLCTAVVVAWHIPFSASIAVSTRIGYLIGRGEVESAKRAARVHAVVFLGNATLDIGLVAILLTFIMAPYFCTDDEVRTIVLKIVPIAAMFSFFDATTCGVHGIMRGLGRQSIAGWISFFINYAYALPLSLYLELGPPQWGLLGVWACLGSALGLTTAVEGLFATTISWKRSADEAKRRNEVVIQ